MSGARERQKSHNQRVIRKTQPGTAGFKDEKGLWPQKSGQPQRVKLEPPEENAALLVL